MYVDNEPLEYPFISLFIGIKLHSYLSNNTQLLHTHVIMIIHRYIANNCSILQSNELLLTLRTL